MFPREDPKQSQSRDEALGRLWDALQESGTLGSDEIESEDIDTITKLHGAEDVPPPDDELVHRMWAGIQTETGLAALTELAPSPNGRHQLATATPGAFDVLAQAPVSGVEADSHSIRRSMRTGIQRVIRASTIALLAGFVVGFIVIGGGARIAMRVAAMLSPEELQGDTTENFETVGEMSLGGTFSLMMEGAFAGVAGCLVFLAIRSWLPRSGWSRSIVTGLVMVVAGGSLVLENGNNEDYEKFGIAGLNVCLFMLLPLFFGMSIGPVTDWFDRRISRSLPTFSSSPVAMIKSIAMCLTVLFSSMAALILLLIPSAMSLFLVLPVIVAVCERLIRLFDRPFADRVVPRLSYIALGSACLVGLVLAAQAVGRIV